MPVFFGLLVLSGVIDFFAVKNDSYLAVDDVGKNPDSFWISQNTPPTARFFNDTFFHPASLAGRRIFLGWPYFVWSYGYDVGERVGVLQLVFNPQDLNEACRLLRAWHMDYLTISAKPAEGLRINRDFFNQNFKLVYENPRNGFKIFDVAQSCLVS